jgi:peptide/nickel transport system permease protein
VTSESSFADAAALANTRVHATVFHAALRSAGGRVGILLTLCALGMAALAPVVTSLDPFSLSGGSLTPPSFTHPFGTDALGRDMLSGVLFGARTSLLVASAVSVVAFLCGMTVGMLGGFAGGMLDDIMLRVTELLQVLPRFLLVIVAVALLGPGLDRLVLVLGLTSWPLLARVVRGETLVLRQADFVTAARATGATNAHILWTTIFPNVLPAAIVVTGLVFAQTLLVEASLGFLGLGDPNAMSWGLLAGQAQPFLRVAWWLPLFPGLAISIAVLGVNLLSDAVSSAIARR